jgi:selenocysteine-specific elongation factor
VRDWAEQYTLAGGIVLDADAGTASFRSAARVKFLQQRAEAPEDVRSSILSQLMRDGATKKIQLLRKSRFGNAEISDAAAGLVVQGDVIAVGEYWANSAKWTALCRQAIDAIDNLHHAHPEHSGMPVNELRAILGPDLPFDDLFDGLIQDLCGSGFVRIGAVIRRVAHRPALPAHLQQAGDRLREALARKPFDPPSRKELAADPASQQALRFLLQTGEAVEINADIVMAAESEKEATELISQFVREHGSATVSDLRQAIGSSRRVIIPFLERLDRAGIMERVADKRVLRRGR